MFERWLVKITEKETGNTHQCERFRTKKRAAAYMSNAVAHLHRNEDIQLIDLRLKHTAPAVVAVEDDDNPLNLPL